MTPSLLIFTQHLSHIWWAIYGHKMSHLTCLLIKSSCVPFTALQEWALNIHDPTDRLAHLHQTRLCPCLASSFLLLVCFVCFYFNPDFTRPSGWQQRLESCVWKQKVANCWEKFWVLIVKYSPSCRAKRSSNTRLKLRLHQAATFWNAAFVQRRSALKADWVSAHFCKYLRPH